MTDDELAEILVGWSTAEILAFVQDETRPPNARSALWAAFSETSMVGDERRTVLRVPARLVEKIRARVRGEVIVEPAEA